MIMVMAMRPKPVQLHVLLLSQFLRKLELHRALLMVMMMVMVMVMVMVVVVSMITVVTYARFMDPRCRDLKTRAQIQKQPKTQTQNHKKYSSHFFIWKRHFQLIVKQTQFLKRRHGRWVSRKIEDWLGCLSGEWELTTFASAFNGDETNDSQKEHDYGDYYAECYHIHSISFFFFFIIIILFYFCFFFFFFKASRSLKSQKDRFWQTR